MSRFVLPENLIYNFLVELLGVVHVVNCTGHSVACVAGGISRASAFVLVAKPWQSAKPWQRGKAVRGLVKSRVEFPRGFAVKALAREIRGRPAREYGGSAARQLRRLDIPYK